MNALLQTVAGTLMLLLAALPASGGRGDSPADGASAASIAGGGVSAMEQRLRSIYAASDWKADPNKMVERASYFRRLLASGQLSVAQKTVVYPQLASELVRAGDPEGALAALDDYGRLLESQASTQGATAGQAGDAREKATQEEAVHELRAIAFLRLGEQENCLSMHGQRSCVFPLRASAAHAMPRGAEGAVRELTWLLEHNPKDALSQWLLNVAYMQLGRYPRAVPARWLLPASEFASEGGPESKIGEFPDYATLAGVDLTSHAGGAAVEDFDGDGYLDVVTSSSGPLDPMHLFHSNGDGTFSDWTERAGLKGELGGLNLVLTDFDNDGHPDILVLRGGWWGKYGKYPMSLLHNRGDGTFEDVTERAGLLRFGPTQTAAWADYDNDGFLDLFVGYEASAGDPHPSLLFHNNRDGTFTEVGEGMGLGAQGFVKGVAWGDFNKDGRPDLYLSVRGGTNRLLRNDGPANAAHPDPAHWRFTDVSQQAGIAPHEDTFATWFFDYNNDGWPDIFVAGYFTDSMQDVGLFQLGKPFHAGLPHLYRNNHDGTFTDVAHVMHLDRAILTMGSNFGDLDNDGWLDVYLGTGEPSFQSLLPNRMFRNAGGARFDDVTTEGGFGHLQKGHAIVFADVENRGQEDVFEEMGGAYPGDPYQSALYRNPGHAGHSLSLRLEGVASNRPGYGARIEVVFRDKGVERHVYRTVGSVSSFGASPFLQHIGVGSATMVDEVKIRWPAAGEAEQVFRSVPVDATYRVREGASALERVPLKIFTLGQSTLHSDALQQNGAGMMHMTSGKR